MEAIYDSEKKNSKEIIYIGEWTGTKCTQSSLLLSGASLLFKCQSLAHYIFLFQVKISLYMNGMGQPEKRTPRWAKKKGESKQKQKKYGRQKYYKGLVNGTSPCGATIGEWMQILCYSPINFCVYKSWAAILRYNNKKNVCGRASSALPNGWNR